MNQESKTGGITILIDVLNEDHFNVIYDINEPDESTCKAFALFLSLLERGTIYPLFLEKIKALYKQNDPKTKEVLESIFTFKKMMDSAIDTPAVLPRDVFRRGG